MATTPEQQQQQQQQQQTAQPPPRLHHFISPRAPPPASPLRHGPRVLSPTKPTRHLSPRKFQQLQQQHTQHALRGMLPLSPIRARHEPVENDSSPHSTARPVPVPWNPAWLPFPMEAVPAAAAKSVGGAGLSLGTASLDAWLQNFDREVLLYESLERFVQVKLPEALAFCDKMENQIAAIRERERVAAAAPPSSCSSNRRASTVAAASEATSAMMRFPVRFRLAVFASLVERAVVAMAQSAGLAHVKPWLLQARQELFRAVFADYDRYSGQCKRSKQRRPSGSHARSDGAGGGQEDEEAGDKKNEDDSDSGDSDSDSDDVDVDGGGGEEEDNEGRKGDRQQRPRQRPRGEEEEKAVSPALRFGPETPRPLSFFLSRVPFLLKLQDDSQRRAHRFQRHQVVLRRIVQSLYRSLGSVFHAWKMLVRARREERLHDKGAQLTAMVVLQRGLVRTIFVEWAKCTLTSKLRRAHEREALAKNTHEEKLNELYKELFLLREQNAWLLEQLALGAAATHARPLRTANEGGDA